VPALLLLLHRRRAGLDLFARPDLVSVPPAVLLQRTQLAGPPTHRRRDRLHACRQRLCAHRRLAAGADLGRSALARRPASGPRSLCPAVLSGPPRNRWFADSPPKQMEIKPLVPDCERVVVSGQNRRRERSQKRRPL